MKHIAQHGCCTSQRFCTSQCFSIPLVLPSSEKRERVGGDWGEEMGARSREIGRGRERERERERESLLGRYSITGGQGLGTETSSSPYAYLVR